ncbi:MAG: type II toxin-antitoxin system RelE/ParE family toxin [Phycisphaeraceae bacterium]|nr:type II toxin-antitoxin system RelE/ParE family toxin [Phycisphaeraceae bacterium]MBX3407281.1 type II toxin-antitoxin system RelE/ParE family toxin [Phycisphaeraceae bacterium]
MRYDVILRAKARDEAVEAARYIAEHASLEAALRWYEGFEDTVGALSTMPARFSLARENGAVAGCELRQVIFKSHRVIFTICARQVHILHIRHVARAVLEGGDLEL